MNQPHFLMDPPLSLPVTPSGDDRVMAILSSVRRAFSEKGFDGASMQDLARAAGMSVGNFYRYFPSKSAIVSALIEADLRMIEADFAEVMDQPAPLEALRKRMHDRLPQHQDCNNGDLWSEISAVARRDGDIGAAALRMEGRIRDSLLSVIAAGTGLSLDAATDRFGAEASFILLLFKAATSVSATEPNLRAHLNAMILRTIDQTLDSIAVTARNP